MHDDVERAIEALQKAATGSAAVYRTQIHTVVNAVQALDKIAEDAGIDRIRVRQLESQLAQCEGALATAHETLGGFLHDSPEAAPAATSISGGADIQLAKNCLSTLRTAGPPAHESASDGYHALLDIIERALAAAPASVTSPQKLPVIGTGEVFMLANELMLAACQAESEPRWDAACNGLVKSVKEVVIKLTELSKRPAAPTIEVLEGGAADLGTRLRVAEASDKKNWDALQRSYNREIDLQGELSRAKAEAGTLLEIQGWRSPSEKPERSATHTDFSDDVLAYLGHGEYAVVYYDFRDAYSDWHSYADEVYALTIEAWQPLPERPQPLALITDEAAA